MVLRENLGGNGRPKNRLTIGEDTIRTGYNRRGRRNGYLLGLGYDDPMRAIPFEYNPNRHMNLRGVAMFADMDADSIYRKLKSGKGIIIRDGENGLERILVDSLDIGRIVHFEKAKITNPQGVKLERYFTDGKTDPFDTVGEYEDKKVRIDDDSGKQIFELDGSFPKSWTQNSAVVTANKYFFKPSEQDWKDKIEKVTGKPHEFSPKHLFGRIAKFFSEEGRKLGYFNNEDKKNFEDELKYLLINQMLAFNSPVNFNAGLYHMYGVGGATSGNGFIRDPRTGRVSKAQGGCYIHPQTHACFIKGPEDNLPSISEQVNVETNLFQNGSGIGQDISNLRAKNERLSGGGKSSGSMTFFELYDRNAGKIKSGGKTRRAARMTTMGAPPGREEEPVLHADILDFVRCKVKSDKMGLDLILEGYSAGMDGEAMTTVPYQNTNISVRLNDAFFKKVEEDGTIDLVEVKTRNVRETIKARELLKRIAFGGWRVGDPGLQYSSEIHRWHTCKNSGRIRSSNPCSEYMFLDDTSCNLASLNLIKFANEKGEFNVESFKRAARISMIAQDIANYSASYPDPDIARISPEFGTTGLGYANLGALLMRKGLAYDSDEARAFAAAVTAIMHGEAYRTSTELAEKQGTFVHYEFNREPMLDVIKKHKNSLDAIAWNLINNKEIKSEAYGVWKEVIERGEKYGFRNAQVTVLAPTGTIAFMMGCDTTGMEPPYALTAVKSLAGGGRLEIVVGEVYNALNNLGYDKKQIGDMLEHVKNRKTIEGSPHIRQEHQAIFYTADTPVPGGKTIGFEGHVRMVAALQPFISGAISKTNNVPEHATVKDIYDGYLLGSKIGLKALAVFRANSKPTRVLSFGGGDAHKNLERGMKEDLPIERDSYEVEVKIGGIPIHIVASEYPDGRVGQIIMESYSSGSTMGALLRNTGILVSTSLKYGVPLEKIVQKMIGQEVKEPQGFTDNPLIRRTKSPLDFLGRWLAINYLGKFEYSDADPEEIREHLNKLRGAKKGFRAYSKQTDLWKEEEVLNDPVFGGFVKIKENQPESIINVNPTVRNGLAGRSTGNPCPKCGNIMVTVKAGCYECRNCFESLGMCDG